MKPTPAVLTTAEKVQRQLPKHCFWDEIEQELYIDARRFFPAIGVVVVMGWDNMMLNAKPIPQYPTEFNVMNWPRQGFFVDWLKQIPAWVKDSCALFPSHQLSLLHYAGKYPQILELLDQAPMLAWQLVKANIEEPEIVALLGGKRAQIAASVGWPGKADTVNFLTNPRLRGVDDNIAEQVETCLLDEKRLSALQGLARVNSMALSLAARFPELIGSQLHHALAQLPCRPMQCKSMVSLLEDAYQLAAYLQLSQAEVNKIGQCRYLVEVNQLYQTWMKIVLPDTIQAIELSSRPTLISSQQDWMALSSMQQHAWFIDFKDHHAKSLKPVSQLYAWQDEEGIWGALVTSHLPASPSLLPQWDDVHGIVKIRGVENILAGAKQVSFLHLWQAQQLKQTD